MNRQEKVQKWPIIQLLPCFYRANVSRYASIALHFYPDRLDPTMKSIAEALLEQRIYKSQPRFGSYFLACCRPII